MYLRRGGESGVIYQILLVKETCFNHPNLNLLLIVSESANICGLPLFVHGKLS